MKSTSEKLILEAPIQTWDEAIPLGNGRTGVLLWGDNKQLKLSLDCGDIWDERVDAAEGVSDWSRRGLEDIVNKADAKRLNHLADVHAAIKATKLPIGRLEFTFCSEQHIALFELDEVDAIGRVWDVHKKCIAECFCASDMQNIVFKICDTMDGQLKIVPPQYSNNDALHLEEFVSTPASLGYPAPEIHENEHLMYYIQECNANAYFGVFVLKVETHEWRIFIQRSSSKAEMEALIQNFSNGKTHSSYKNILNEHKEWWRQFWQRSVVRVPDAKIQQIYNLSRYYYGAASRIGAPPMPLQAVWTANDDTLPPWKGDYHHDLNTQMSYIAYLTSGDFDCGLSFLNHLSSQINIYRHFAESFYGVQGVAVPGTATLDGQLLGGWLQYSGSPTNSAWLATMFTDHYRYTMDPDFLNQQAWPFVSGVGEFICNLLKEDENGCYTLPLSSSPEIHDGTLAAFLPSFSNYDLALIKRLFSDLAYLSLERQEEEIAIYWKKCSSKLPEFAVDPEMGLKICKEENLPESHRHHSHMIGIYPMRLLDPQRDKETVDRSFLHLDTLGTGKWDGYSFSWASAMAAYCGKGERALRMLRIYEDGFISRNGFHLNGDFKDLGYSQWKFRPFSIEGNFLAMQAIHEMLISSYHSFLRIFPAIPQEWRDLDFYNLRAEGGLFISAKLQDGKFVYLEIEATCSCNFILKNPARGIDHLNRYPQFKNDQDTWNVHLAAGEKLVFA